LHQNSFGGRAPPGPAGGAIALPRPPSRYQGRGGKGRGGRAGEGKEGEGKGRKGRGKKGKGEGKGHSNPPSKKSGYGPGFGAVWLAKLPIASATAGDTPAFRLHSLMVRGGTLECFMKQHWLTALETESLCFLMTANPNVHRITSPKCIQFGCFILTADSLSS